MSKILIINSAEPGITEFTEPLVKIVKTAGYRPTVIDYAQCTEQILADTDGVIISGSPQGDDIVEHHLPWFTWLKTFEKPVLGICAGHHITGFLFGSELLRSEEPESGDFEVQILNDDAIFRGFGKQFTVRQMHNDSITLPDDFVQLATSYICRNQLMKHRHKRLYTCQFHPEYYNYKLIGNFLNLCEKKST